jgi:hypothetical protein
VSRDPRRTASGTIEENHGDPQARWEMKKQ